MQVLHLWTGTRKSRLKGMSKGFVLDTDGLRTEVLQADWMKDYIESEARSQADSDSHVVSFIGFDRAKAIIYPNTKEHPE